MIEKIVLKPGCEDEKICLPNPAEVMNFTGETIRILDGYGREVMSYPCYGWARLRLANGAEAEWPEARYYVIEGLPEYASGVSYLVNWEVAEIAKRAGRKLDDLWLPTQPCFMDEGVRLEQIGYARIVNAESLAHCFL